MHFFILPRRCAAVLLLAIAALLAGMPVRAYEQRDLLRHHVTNEQLSAALVAGTEWVPYPPYTDRAAWARLVAPCRDSLIARGERLLAYRWQDILASAYLAYQRTGDRRVMEDPYFDNYESLRDLLYAELAEGKGRFMPQLIDGVWHACEMTSWTLSAHLPRQRSHSSLPAYDDQVIAIFTGDMAELLSWTYYFMHKEFDKTSPEISRRLAYELRRHILTPFPATNWHWLGLGEYQGKTLLNNWTPWCCHNVLLTYLLMETDPAKRADAAWTLLSGVDEYLNYITPDGACDEGSSYWAAAAERVYQFLDLVRLATGGRVNLFGLPSMRAQGEYIARSYVGNGWTVNFADAQARSTIEAPMVWLYGRAVGSTFMEQFAAYLMSGYGHGRPHLRYADVAKLKPTAWLSAMAHHAEMESTRPALNHPAVTWYPETQFCYMTSRQGLFLACKGGHNNESHNHNDVGEFILYVDTMPVFIDVGVGVYTKQTFSADRYKIWTMQSDYHNLPRPNGVSQHAGTQYKATAVTCDARRQLFSADIAGAYPKEAGVQSWLRSYRLRGRQVEITDRFHLSRATAPNEVNFMAWGEVDATQPGVVRVDVQGRHAELRYDARQFTASTQPIDITDPYLLRTWGRKLTRITLRAKQLERQGTYLFTVGKP